MVVACFHFAGIWQTHSPVNFHSHGLFALVFTHFHPEASVVSGQRVDVNCVTVDEGGQSCLCALYHLL